MIVGVLSSCSSKKDTLLSAFPKAFEGQFEILSSELIGYNYVNDMFVSKNHVIVTCFDLESQTFIHVFDKDGFNPLNYLREGRGDGEMIYGGQRYSLIDDELTVLDPLHNRQIVFVIDSLLLKGIRTGIIDYVDVPKWNVVMYPLGGHSYVCLNERPPLSRDTTTVHRLEVYRDGICVSHDDWVPIEDKYIRFRSSPHTKIDINHAKNMMALASPYGSELETLHVENGMLNRSGVCVYERSDFNGENGIAYNENTIVGYNDLCSTEDYVIAVFDGRKMFEAERMGGAHFFREIGIFTWDAKPVARISVDARMESICYDNEERSFYAVITDDEGRAVLARLRFDLNTLKRAQHKV